MATIRPFALPPAAAVNPSSAIINDDGAAVTKATPLQIVDAARPKASQVEAQTGTDNEKIMTPLRVAQAIDALAVSASKLASTALGEGAALVGDKLDATGAVGRTQHEINSDVVSVKDFGAVGDGVTDDSAAITLADTYAAAIGATLWFPAGVYAANSLTLTAALDMEPSATLLYNGPEDGDLVDFAGSGKECGRFNADANQIACTLLEISGDQNSFDVVNFKNNYGSATAGLSNYGLLLMGDRNTVGTCRIQNFQANGQPNESFPQAILAYGDSNSIDSIKADVSQSVLVLSSACGQFRFGELEAKNCVDNAIYQLGGQLSGGTVVYDGTNEPLVFKGGSVGATASIARLDNFGTGIIGLEDAGDVAIGHVHVGPNVGSIIRTRAGQTASGRVSIGKITGDMLGSTLWAMNIGTVDWFSVDEMDLVYRHTTGTITSWADFSAAKGFKFGTLTIKIIDVNDALVSSASRFTLRAPTTNLASESFVNAIVCTIVKGSDGSPSPALMRGVSFFADTRTHVANAYVERSGPFIREVAAGQAFSGLVQDSALAPSAGTYRTGEIFKIASPTAGGPVRWLNTAGGSPGTWVADGVAGAVRAASVPYAAGATPTKAEFDALIDAFKAAGSMA